MQNGKEGSGGKEGQWWFLWARLVGQGFWHIVAGLNSMLMLVDIAAGRVGRRLHEKMGPYVGGGSSEGNVADDSCVVISEEASVVALDSVLVISEEASIAVLSGGLVLPVGASVVVICGKLDLPEGASVVRTVAGYWSGFHTECVDLSVRLDFLTCSG